jgi:hypothetical protein
MQLIELPRALEMYFAFAEMEPTRRGRRFSITLPYYVGERLDRLQWWYHVSPAQEQMHDGHALTVFRERETQRFLRHIEQWLANTQARLHGNDAIPHVSSTKAIAPVSVDTPVSSEDAAPAAASEQSLVA